MTKHIITDGEFHLEATGDINLRSTTGSINMFGVGDVMNEGNASFAGDVTISGNLTVLGTPTTVNSTDTLIKDNIIELNVGEVGAGVSSLYSGIQIDRGSLTDVAIRWNETTDKWQITNDGTTYLNIAAASGIFLENVVEDTTPQLGGDLDVTGTSFVTTSNGNITFAPNGTGDVLPGTDSTYDFGATATRWANIYSDALDATSITGTLQTAAQANITSLGTLSGLGVTGTVTVTGQLDIDNLSVNGNTVTATTGDITLTPATGSAVNLDDTNITADGGVFTITGQIDVDNININGNTISSTDANGNIVLTPNGTGATQGVVNINTNSAMNLPAGTTAERPAAFGSAGDFRFNTSTANIEYSDGGSWTSLIGTSTNIISQGNSDVTVSDAGVGTITMTVDGGTTATFDVDGLDIVTGDTYQINGTSVLSSTTLGSGVTASSLTSVGTISSGTWSGSFGAVSGANITSLTAANISSGNLGSGVYSYAMADAQNFAYKISFLDTTLNSSGNFQQLFESGAGEFTYNPNTDTLTVGTISVGAITGTSISGYAQLGVAQTFTKTQTWTKGADVASASSLTLGDGNYFDITGTTTVTAISTKGTGTVVKLHFDAALTLTHHASNLVLPGGANITTAVGDEAEFTEFTTGQWRCTNYQVAASAPGGGSGGLQSVQVFTAGGTWTRPAGIALVKVFVTGGGGGGGDGSSTNHISAGGGGGGTAIKYLDVSALSSETVTVGAAGAGGVGGASGGNGGTSSFGALCSATGGIGGGANYSQVSASGGVGSSGDMNLDGARGGIGAASQAYGTGAGGGSFWSPTMSSGRGSTQYETATPVAGTYGRGGQGNTNNDGGAGGAGVVVVEEYA